LAAANILSHSHGDSISINQTGCTSILISDEKKQPLQLKVMESL